MQHSQGKIWRKGFSLIELLLVIFIISIVYYLGFSGIEIGTKKEKALSPLNIKDNISNNKSFAGHATLMCVDKCKSCYLRSSLSSGFKAYSSAVDLLNIQAYTLDERESLTRIEYGRYNDKKICLIMDFYSNGSSTQIILKDEKNAYFLPAFFGEPQKFDTINDAKDEWMKYAYSVSNSGEFY